MCYPLIDSFSEQLLTKYFASGFFREASWAKVKKMLHEPVLNGGRRAVAEVKAFHCIQRRRFLKKQTICLPKNCGSQSMDQK